MFMYVLPMLLAAATAGQVAPLAYSANLAYHTPLTYAAGAPLIKTVAAAPAHLSYAAAAPLAYAAAPALTYAAAAPVVGTVAAPPRLAARPVACRASRPCTANTPVVTGYRSQILKPAFPALRTRHPAEKSFPSRRDRPRPFRPSIITLPG
ncbi:Hypothetical predicted protein [Cloeon dipterum]|uniref:Uncharacterized protein n=1 Tax=Cloeon dipterum TaxID=197152 RepID=A0A8S1D6M5_9INSE|nr:Hypothetical predicted protein [Cloeon dipterum]